MTIKTLVPIFSLIFYFSAAKAQILIDNFDDGNLTDNPEWRGQTTDFTVNAAFQLQLNAQDDESSPAYLSVAFDQVSLQEKEWRFDVRLDFAPSNTNKVVIYLTSSTSNLLQFTEAGNVQEGYFLEIGENGSNDAINLFYRNGTSTTLVARGEDGQFSSSFEKRVRVRRGAGGSWEIATASIDSENYVVTASGTHNSYNLAQNLGFICYFSTTRSDLFFFDNLYFGDYINDTIPPEIVNYKVNDETNVTLYFSEIIDSLSAAQPGNYHVRPEKGVPAMVDAYDDSVRITFPEPFESGVEYSLIVENVADEAGNIMVPDSLNLLYYILEEAEHRDIIINEFLADPNPSEGLPEAEFIELYNRSNKFISLKNWTISDNTRSEGTLPDFVLAPQAYVIICASNFLSQYQVFGPAIAPSSWQILNITGDSIVLKNEKSLIIDALAYTKDWYQDDDKSDGGYSLELINADLTCYDPFNWIASNSNIGGTPAQRNSVKNLDFTGAHPLVESYFFPDPNKVVLIFDKTMDFNSLQSANYTLSPAINVLQVLPDSIDKKRVDLILTEALSHNQKYELMIEEVTDCNGNSSQNLSLSFVYDNLAPKVQEIVFLTDSILLLKFDEAIILSSATDPSTYQLAPFINISEVNLNSTSEVILFFNQSLGRGGNYTLFVNGVEDIFGNKSIEEEINFVFEGAKYPKFNQLLVTEIMANPAPDRNLPDVQYIELYNTTEVPLSLFGLQYMDSRDTVILDFHYILPKEYLIVCPNSRTNVMETFGRTIGLSPWPNLNNAGDDLQVMNTSTGIVHQVSYRDSWYKEDFKRTEGGWSLEMIDTRNPCTGFSNWAASQAQRMGTPGTANSIKEENPDLRGPEVVSAYAAVATEVEVIFDEVLDLPDLRTDQFLIQPAVNINSIEVVDSHTVRLLLSQELALRQQYAVIVDQVSDCAGNLINTENSTAVFGLVEEPEQNDIVLNEVLYHPNTGGVDFIELYNRSEKFINLRNWLAIASTQERILFPEQNVVMAPGDILAITSDKEKLVSQYPTSSERENVKETDLPNFINEEGIVHIISANRMSEELFEYNDELHIPFLRTSQGVSLERISPDADVNEPESWRSAASSSGYATPGARNSQLATESISFGKVKANPQSFAHNAPGRNYTLISYDLGDLGNLATVKIFDAKGTIVKVLANNETINTSGFFRWDGDDNLGRKVSTGYYIIYFELFSSNGNTRVLKERVAVGANF